MNQVAEQIAGTLELRGMPELNKGETYVRAITDGEGKGHHIILLPGDKDDGNWQDAMNWAKEQGGDLPDRIEQAILFAHFKDQFKQDIYWSNTTHASHEDCAWCQHFTNGAQHWNDKSNGNVRARAVRRVPI